MAFNYIVTANRATAVNECLTGNFTRRNDINLITAKLSRIEISNITPDGLKPIQEIGVYGKIEALRLFRPPGYEKDLLFMLTNKYHVAILECVEGQTPDSIDIITRRSGNIADSTSRTAETGNIVIIDPSCKVIALRLYDGLLKIIPIEQNSKTGDIEAFNIRMDENITPDITFLHGFQNPTIGFIWKKQNDPDRPSSHVKTYEILLKEKELSAGPWSKENVANEASFIIPIPQPFGGAVIIALESIVYINNDKERVIAPPLIKQSPISCWAPIDKDGRRFLLGDLSGRLFALILEPSEYRPNDAKLEVGNLSLELLGEISIPHCMVYLDNAIVYVGSKFGDSQLIKLLNEQDENGLYLQVCHTFNNLGPIADMCLVDLEKQAQGQLVTCSGYVKDGTLRIIRNGIGINEHASMDVPDIKGIWSLKMGVNQAKDNHLLLTFRSVSFIWRCEDDGDFQNIPEGDGFDRTKRTVLATNVAHNQIIQVTREDILLINCESRQLCQRKVLSKAGAIHRVAHNDNQVACADGDKLFIIDVNPGELTIVNETTLEAQIAALDISPADEKIKLLSVGFWFNQFIVIYSLPDLTVLHREPLINDYIPRSIITARFEENSHLLCALQDGSVYYFNLDPCSGVLSNPKKVTLGTYEITLKSFRSKSTHSIFACSDRPTVIYSSNNKLVFSNVNLKEVHHMCSLDTNYYSDSLALVNDEGILFGTIDEIQKLHIKTIHLNESPLKIAHQESSKTFGLLTERKDYQDALGINPIRQSASTTALTKSSSMAMSTGTTKPTGMAIPDTYEIDTSNFLILDQKTFEVLHAHQLMPTERAMSILSARLGEKAEEYYIVGTAFVISDEPEPKQGRLIVFRWTRESSLEQVAELSIKGCPYSLCEFEGRKFLAGVNASVSLVELNSRRDLHVECTYSNATMALYLKRLGNLIVLGDLMRSITVFEYKPMQSHFEEVARDGEPAWMMEAEILDDKTFLGADDKFNLFVLQRDKDATSDQDTQQMQHVGLFHLGDSVNVCLQGSLIVQHPSETNIEVKRSTLYGTVEGVVGQILTIDETLFKQLEKIQDVLSRHVKSIGKIDHKEWRSFTSCKGTHQTTGFIDGDLVETFLDLGRDKMDKVARETGITLEELVRTIEELSRLH